MKRIYIGVNKMDSGTAGSKQARYDEISIEMKSILIKICWTKDFIEKNTHNQPKQSERRSARRTAVLVEQGVSILTFQQQ